MIFSTVYNLDNEINGDIIHMSRFLTTDIFLCCITQRPGHNTKLHPRDEGGSHCSDCRSHRLTWVQTLTGSPFHSWSNLKLRSVCAYQNRRFRFRWPLSRAPCRTGPLSWSPRLIMRSEAKRYVIVLRLLVQACDPFEQEDNMHSDMVLRSWTMKLI